MAWLVAGVWKLNGIRKNRDKGSCPPCLGEVCQTVLLDCIYTRDWRKEIAEWKVVKYE
jgi:hypothetical protein